MSVFSSYTTRIENRSLFVGRHAQLARANEWLFPQSEDMLPSFAICGLTRVGKTSLALQLVRTIHDRSDSDVGMIYVDTTKLFIPQGCNSARFWNKLAEKVRTVKALPHETKETTTADAVEAFDRFETVLETKSKRIVFFLDEFDRCLHLSDLSDFLDALRSLINGASEYRIQFVLICRRSPELIQSKTDGSTLPGTLQRIDLRPFSKEEFQELVGKFRSEGHFLSDVESESIWELTKGHPYLTNAILSEIRYIAKETINRSDAAYAAVSSVFESYFQEVLNFFDEISVERRFQTEMVSTWRDCLFFERLYGRAIPPDTRMHLVRYGLSGNDATVSSVFDQFLKQAVAASTNWEELTRLEKRIRDYIDSALCSYYGTDEWFGILDVQPADVWAQDKETGMDIFKNTVFGWFSKDKKRNPGLKNRPIDFCYFDDLAGLMCMEQHWNPNNEKNWKGFSSLFHGSKEECRSLMDSIGAIRNPEAHSRDYPKDFQIRFSDAKDKLDQILNDRIDL